MERTWLKERRKLYELSEEEMAKRLFLSTEYYKGIEAGEKQKQLDPILAGMICATLRIPPHLVYRYEQEIANKTGKTAAAKIKEARLLVGLSQRQLAELCGVSEAAVMAYEAGARIPRDEVKISLAKHLGASMESLFC